MGTTPLDDIVSEPQTESNKQDFIKLQGSFFLTALPRVTSKGIFLSPMDPHVTAPPGLEITWAEANQLGQGIDLVVFHRP